MERESEHTVQEEIDTPVDFFAKKDVFSAHPHITTLSFGPMRFEKSITCLIDLTTSKQIKIQNNNTF